MNSDELKDDEPYWQFPTRIIPVFPASRNADCMNCIWFALQILWLGLTKSIIFGLLLT